MRQNPMSHPLAEEVRYFFRINPDEELSAHDCSVKFDCHHNQALHVMNAMRANGALICRKEGNTMIFAKGTP